MAAKSSVYTYIHTSSYGFDLVLVKLYFGTIRTPANTLKFHNNMV